MSNSIVRVICEELQEIPGIICEPESDPEHARFAKRVLGSSAWEGNIRILREDMGVSGGLVHIGTMKIEGTHISVKNSSKCVPEHQPQHRDVNGNVLPPAVYDMVFGKIDLDMTDPSSIDRLVEFVKGMVV